MTEAEIKAECLYYETLDLAQLVGTPGQRPTELLMECTNALANLRASLVEHFDATSRSKLN